MQVQRPNYARRSSLPLLPCACLSIFVMFMVLLVAGFFILLPALPSIGAQLMGFQQSGTIEEVFEQQPVAIAPQIVEASTVEQVTIQIPGFDPQTIQENAPLYDFSIGTIGESNTQALTVSFTEAGLMELCRQRTNFCSNENPQFQNVRIDLRPNGAVIYADAVIAQLGNVRQTLGMVVQLDTSGRRFQFVGVDIGGALFTSPPQELRSLVTEFENGANNLLTQLSLQAGGSQYTLSRAYIDDSNITLLMQ